MPKRPRVLSLSPKEMIILELLVEHGELYGLQLVAQSRRRLKRGTVYVTLGRMEDKGFVASKLDTAASPTGGLPRRRYAPTALGRRVLTVWTSVTGPLLPELAR